MLCEKLNGCWWSHILQKNLIQEMLCKYWEIREFSLQSSRIGISITWSRAKIKFKSCNRARILIWEILIQCKDDLETKTPMLYINWYHLKFFCIENIEYCSWKEKLWCCCETWILEMDFLHDSLCLYVTSNVTLRV